MVWCHSAARSGWVALRQVLFDARWREQNGQPAPTPARCAAKAFAGETRENIYKIFGPSGLIAQLVRGENDGAVVGESTLYIHPDEQGSPALIRDDSQTDHAAPRWTTSGAPEGGASWESTDDPLSRTVRTTYTGHEFDEELGLTNMQGRIFDQAIGRFMQPDPMVQAPYNSQGLNRYSYALNSPQNLVDPSGFDSVEHRPDGSKMTTVDEQEVCGGAGCDRASASARASGEHSHGQGDPGASKNGGQPDGSASQTGNSANGKGADPSGGDGNRGRPASSPGAPGSDGGRAQSAQTQHGTDDRGDFSPGNAQTKAGENRTPVTSPSGPSVREMVGIALCALGCQHSHDGNYWPNPVGDYLQRAIDDVENDPLAALIVLGQDPLVAADAAAEQAAKASSRRLGRALEIAGHTRPTGSEAHHIVAGAAKRAEPARAVLQKFGTGIDSAANGIFLPAETHAGGHTNAYYDAVNAALGQATTRQEAIEALAAVGQGLVNGSFP